MHCTLYRPLNYDSVVSRCFPLLFLTAFVCGCVFCLKWRLEIMKEGGRITPTTKASEWLFVHWIKPAKKKRASATRSHWYENSSQIIIQVNTTYIAGQYQNQSDCWTKQNRRKITILFFFHRRLFFFSSSLALALSLSQIHKLPSSFLSSIKTNRKSYTT